MAYSCSRYKARSDWVIVGNFFPAINDHGPITGLQKQSKKPYIISKLLTSNVWSLREKLKTPGFAVFTGSLSPGQYGKVSLWASQNFSKISRSAAPVFLTVMCDSQSRFLYEAVSESRFFARLGVSNSSFVRIPVFITDFFSSLDIEFL